MAGEAKTLGKRVLIALDGSVSSANAFHWYMNNGLLSTDQIILAYCVPGASSGDPDEVLSPKEEEKVQQTIASIEALANSYNIEHTLERLHGQPEEAIIKAAKEFAVTMIVAGSRGHGKLRRTIMGSISDFIVNHSPIPVIIVKFDLQHQSSREDDVPTSPTKDKRPSFGPFPTSPTKDKRPSFPNTQTKDKRPSFDSKATPVSPTKDKRPSFDSKDTPVTPTKEKRPSFDVRL